VRTFIAIELPETVKEEIAAFQKEIKKSLSLRFVSPKNLHLTLFFLGETEKIRLPEVIEAVRAGSRGIKPFYLSLTKPEFFPHGLWFKIGGQVEVLEKLYEQIKEELKTRSFPLEERPFNPHVTVGRAKGRVEKVERITMATGIKGGFEVSSVAFFKSQLTRGEPIYSKITTVGLK